MIVQTQSVQNPDQQRLSDYGTSGRDPETSETETRTNCVAKRFFRSCFRCLVADNPGLAIVVVVSGYGGGMATLCLTRKADEQIIAIGALIGAIIGVSIYFIKKRVKRRNEEELAHLNSSVPQNSSAPIELRMLSSSVTPTSPLLPS